MTTNDLIIANTETIKVIDNIQTGEKARMLRIKNKISLRTMATKMGISAMYLSDLERGNRNWSYTIAGIFVRVLTGDLIDKT